MAQSRWMSTNATKTAQTTPAATRARFEVDVAMVEPR
jgi:hypothetical protein